LQGISGIGCKWKATPFDLADTQDKDISIDQLGSFEIEQLAGDGHKHCPRPVHFSQSNHPQQVHQMAPQTRGIEEADNPGHIGRGSDQLKSA